MIDTSNELNVHPIEQVSQTARGAVKGIQPIDHANHKVQRAPPSGSSDTKKPPLGGRFGALEPISK